MSEYTSELIDPSDEINIWAVRAPDGDLLATDDCAQLLNELTEQLKTARELLRKIVAHEGGYYSASTLYVETRDLDAAREYLEAQHDH